jgi:glycosyltransferase involved in cell wall biosynthesis
MVRRYDTAVKGGGRLRILVWHGWLLEGTGANIYAAKVAEVWRRQGHQVVILCQQRFTERLGFVDLWNPDIGRPGKQRFEWGGHPAAPGRVEVLNPDIGDLLPVFVLDHYEGFRVRRFIDLTDAELDRYLDRNVTALRRVAGDHPPDAVVAGHLVPGPVVVRRALGDNSFVAKAHGSDLEYAIHLQERYADVAQEGVAGAVAVAGASRDVLARAEAAVPAARGKTVVIPPGVDVDRWRPRTRIEALEDVADRLAADPDPARGRPAGGPLLHADPIRDRDAAALDAAARAYDQAVPDPDAAARLRSLAGHPGPIVGYMGKLIPQKGVERFIDALALMGPEVHGVVVGFGLGREWLAALAGVLDQGDVDGYRWLAEASPLVLELDDAEVKGAAGLEERLTFTGRLDHRYAPEVVAALDVLVVPSTLKEAFGMVAAEGAAAGAVPVVARHSSLAEVAGALEGAAGRPGLLSFEPGAGATHRLADVLDRLLRLPLEDRMSIRGAIRAHVAGEWTWDRTAQRLLAAARA